MSKNQRVVRRTRMRSREKWVKSKSTSNTDEFTSSSTLRLQCNHWRWVLMTLRIDFRFFQSKFHNLRYIPFGNVRCEYRTLVQTSFSGRISLIRIFQAGSLLGFNFHTILLRLCKWRFCKSSTQSRCGTATYAKPADLRIDFLSLVKVFSVCRKLTRGMKNGSI